MTRPAPQRRNVARFDIGTAALSPSVTNTEAL